MCPGVNGAEANHTLRAQRMGSGVRIVMGRRLEGEAGTHLHFQASSRILLFGTIFKRWKK